jgi:hypothetical protein
MRISMRALVCFATNGEPVENNPLTWAMGHSSLPFETDTKFSAQTQFIGGPTSELLTILQHVPILIRNCIHYG